MKLYRILLIAALGALSLAACKKDEETTTSKSMTGALTVGEVAEYSNPGDNYTLTASGLSLASDETDQSIEIIYYFKVDDFTDTTNTMTVIIPDTLGTYSFSVYGAATGYYTKSLAVSTTVVSERSITNARRLGAPDCVDARDNKEYYTMTAGGLSWFTQNLAYFEKDTEGEYTLGRPYSSCKATEDVMGGFYTWTDAQTACPAGWRLPTADEFDALATNAGDLMVDAYFNGSRLWEFWPGVKVTNAAGFFAMPFGYATVVDNAYTFYGFGDYCYYWVDNAGAPECRSIYVKDSDIKVWGSPSPTDFAAQVRCVK